MWIVALDGYEERGVWVEQNPHLLGPFVRYEQATHCLDTMKVLRPTRKYKIYKVEEVSLDLFDSDTSD